jgi:hypothetical protein
MEETTAGWFLRDLASRIHARNAAECGQIRTDANDPVRPFANIYDYLVAELLQMGCPGFLLPAGKVALLRSYR